MMEDIEESVIIPDHPSMDAILKHVQCNQISFCEQHCSKCIFKWCPLTNFHNQSKEHDTADDAQSNLCPSVDCPNFCGFRMHKCKVDEHLKQTCSLQVVPCLCYAYGCVLEMPRHRLGQHLIDCPASIVHCTVEWNRWPRFSGEKHPCLNPRDFPPRHYSNGQQINLRRDLSNQDETYSVFISNESHSCQSNSCNHFSHLVSWNEEFMDEGLLDDDLCMSQFDLAMAARDQNILQSGLSVSKHTRRALRNSLTERYPALPLPSTFTSCPHRCGSEPPCSSCSSNSTNSTIQDDPERHYGPPGLSSTVCDRLFSRNLSSEKEDPPVSVTAHANSLYHTDIPQPYVPPASSYLPHSHTNGSTDSAYYVDSGQDDVAFLKFIKESGLLHSSVYCGAICPDSAATIQASNCGDNRASLLLNNLCDSNVRSGGGDDQDAVTPLTETMARAVTERSLQVDTLMEFYPRYQHKPRAMYTFLCASDVRRREFPDHYKLHCDVVCQMDGWIEQRCPLAYLGCPFIMKRLCPNSKNCSLVYSPRLSSFSLRYSSVKSRSFDKATSPTDSKIKLTDFPNEVLIRIFNFVDNFTMHSLCRTCSRFRSICAYLLPTRGSVSLLWQRRRIGEVKHWYCSEKVWFYTFGTDSISKWCPIDSASHELHEHLTNCEFFDKCEKQEPYCLIHGGFPFEQLANINRRKQK